MLLLMMIFFIYPTNFAITAEEQAGLGLQATTLLMVGLDLFAFFVGLVFGQLMNIFREPIKYFAPVFFLIGYILFASAHSVLPLLVGSVFNSATTVMPLLSAALYLGQFLSPIVVTPLSRLIFGDNDVAGCYKIGIALCLVFLAQVYSTRHYQSLPPKSK